MAGLTAAIKFACASYCRGGADDPDLVPMIEGARAKWNKPGRTCGPTTIDELNEKYCVVCDNGKTRVLSFERQDQKVGNRTHVRHVATFMRFEDFANFYLDEKILIGNKPMPVGRVVAASRESGQPRQTQIRRHRLPPGDESEVVNGKLNLWRGFGVTEKQGDWSLMRQHIQQVLASNNTDHATYIINWIAWAVQNPADRAEVALVFRGKKGTGKGTLGNTLVIHLRAARHPHLQQGSPCREVQLSPARRLLPVCGRGLLAGRQVVRGKPQAADHRA